MKYNGPMIFQVYGESDEAIAYGQTLKTQARLAVKLADNRRGDNPTGWSATELPSGVRILGMISRTGGAPLGVARIEVPSSFNSKKDAKIRQAFIWIGWHFLSRPNTYYSNYLFTNRTDPDFVAMCVWEPGATDKVNGIYFNPQFEEDGMASLDPTGIRYNREPASIWSGVEDYPPPGQEFLWRGEGPVLVDPSLIVKDSIPYYVMDPEVYIEPADADPALLAALLGQVALPPWNFTKLYQDALVTPHLDPNYFNIPSKKAKSGRYMLKFHIKRSVWAQHLGFPDGGQSSPISIRVKVMSGRTPEPITQLFDLDLHANVSTRRKHFAWPGGYSSPYEYERASVDPNYVPDVGKNSGESFSKQTIAIDPFGGAQLLDDVTQWGINGE